MSQNIPFQHINWTLVPKQEYRGEMNSPGIVGDLKL